MLKEIQGIDLASSIRALAEGESVIDRKVLSQVLAVVRQSAESGGSEQHLSERQRTILRLVADGLSNREIGEQVHLSELTVKSYIEDLLISTSAPETGSTQRCSPPAASRDGASPTRLCRRRF